MPKKPLTILAINPGSKYLGIAVFQGEWLRDWRIKVLKGKWSNEKCDRSEAIITKLIEHHKPDALALKKLHPARSSLNLTYLVEQIKDLAHSKELPVYQYTIEDLKDFFSPGRKLNKKGLAGVIATRLPDLYQDYQEDQRHKNPYLIRMFEAVALGIVCFHQLDKK